MFSWYFETKASLLTATPFWSSLPSLVYSSCVTDTPKRAFLAASEGGFAIAVANPPPPSKYSPPPYLSKTAFFFVAIKSVDFALYSFLSHSAWLGFACGWIVAVPLPAASHANNCVSANPTASPDILTALSPMYWLSCCSGLGLSLIDRDLGS